MINKRTNKNIFNFHIPIAINPIPKKFMRGMPQTMALGFISFILLFFWGLDSSPFYGECFHYDPSVYYVMGSSLLEGHKPYTDYFDNKGIILYCLYAIGIVINGSRIGIFIMEWLFLLCSSILVVGIDKRLNPSQQKSVTTSLAAFFVLYFSLSEGPLTENFSIPLQLLSIYIYMHDTKNKGNRKFYGYGMCLAILFFIRPNNIVFTLSAILCTPIRDKKSAIKVGNLANIL